MELEDSLKKFVTGEPSELALGRNYENWKSDVAKKALVFAPPPVALSPEAPGAGDLTGRGGAAVGIAVGVVAGLDWLWNNTDLHAWMAQQTKWSALIEDVPLALPKGPILDPQLAEQGTRAFNQLVRGTNMAFPWLPHGTFADKFPCLRDCRDASSQDGAAQSASRPPAAGTNTIVASAGKADSGKTGDKVGVSRDGGVSGVSAYGKPGKPLRPPFSVVVIRRPLPYPQ